MLENCVEEGPGRGANGREAMFEGPDESQRATDDAKSRKRTRSASMKTNAVRCAAGLVFLVGGAPLPACGQFIYPPVFVVPPPAQDYGASRPASRLSPDKPKPADPPAQAKPAGHYEGRTYVPD
jgi:hypothetical protein